MKKETEVRVKISGGKGDEEEMGAVKLSKYLIITSKTSIMLHITQKKLNYHKLIRYESQ